MERWIADKTSGRHAELHHKKRDVVAIAVTATDVVNLDVIVYEDSEGSVISASTHTAVSSGAPVVVNTQPAPAAPAVTSAAAAPAAPVAKYQPVQAAPVEQGGQHGHGLGGYGPPAQSAAAPSTAAAPAPAPAQPVSPSTKGTGEYDLGGRGVSYDPYTGGPVAPYAPAPCRDVSSDISYLGGIFSIVRLYDITPCNVVQDTIATIKSKKLNTKVIAGLPSYGSWSNDLSTLISIVGGNWNIIHTVVVGNEWVSGGQAGAGSVADAVNTARSTLRDAGFNGPVITVDQTAALLSNAQLTAASDYVGANIHAYFDPNTAAPNAAKTVQSQIDSLKSSNSGKQVIVTESGWPSAGESIGQAVPSSDNKEVAVKALLGAFTDNIVLFAAYDDTWKQPGPNGCEQSFGLFPALASLF